MTSPTNSDSNQLPPSAPVERFPNDRGSFDHPLARTPDGTFRGSRKDGIAAWLGIPYAQAPIGSLRWRPPVPVEVRREPSDALSFGPACIQTALHPDACRIYREVFLEQGEDCLTLNIWAPGDARDLPVFVWIHGGALVQGGSASPMFDGTRLAAEGLVIVTLNYRIGVLGFLAHEELSAESSEGVSGNYGLLDQVTALRWINRNIAGFGGDPGNVTLAGESAGALSILCHLTSPASRHLFHRAIAQSPYMVSLPSLRANRHGHMAAEFAGTELLNRLGKSGIAELRQMPAEELVSQASSVGFVPWPTVDGKVIPRQLVDSFEGGDQAPVPVLTGFNGGEIRSLRRLLPSLPKSSGDYENHIRSAYGQHARAFLSAYPASGIDESMLAATRDAMYGWSAQMLAISQGALGAPSYVYLFDHGYPQAEQSGLKAFHAAELPFVFGTISSVSADWPVIPMTSEQTELSETMVQYWSTFAKGGAPRAPGGPDWPDFRPDNDYMLFDNGPRVERDPLGQRFAIHSAIVDERRRAGDVPWNWNVGFAAPTRPEAS